MFKRSNLNSMLTLFSKIHSQHYPFLGTTATQPPFLTNRIAAAGANYPHRRTIVNIADLKGTHDIFDKHNKHLSPLNGAIFTFTGAMNRFYDLANTDRHSSASTQLALELFHKQDQELRATQNKSNPAYSLNPSLLADILYHLGMGTLNNQEVRNSICQALKKQYHLDTGSQISTKKINSLLDCISRSKQECIAKKYPLFLTETILLSFLHYKASSREAILAFLNKMNLIGEKVDIGKIIPNDTFKENDIKMGKKIISDFKGEHTSDLLNDNYEKILLSLMLRDHQLKPVLQSRYAFNHQPTKANCVEVSFHNLCNILLYNERTGLFDFSLLPQTLSCHEDLKRFYHQQQYQTNTINTVTVGQAFMDLVSDRKELLYRSGNYELESTSKNFIPLMNLLFGSTATSLAALSKQFSTQERQILFSENDDNVIIITIQSPQKKLETIVFEFRPNHAVLKANRFNFNAEIAIDATLARLKEYASRHMADDPLLLSLLDYITELDESSSSLSNADIIDKLNTLLIYHFPKTMNQALNLIDLMTPYLPAHPNYQHYIGYLLSKFSGLLFAAVTGKHSVESVRALLQAGANPDSCDQRGRTPLHYARTNKIAEALIHSGANPNAADNDGITPLHHVKCSAIANVLIKAGANPNAVTKQGLTPLLCHAGDEVILKLLLAAGANPNIIDELGRTLLFHTRNRSIANDLLAAGADPNARDQHGQTPLHYCQNREVIEALLKAGANVHLIDEEGKTPLHQTDYVSELLAAGANANALDQDGKTPLHYARDVMAVEALLNAGANPNIADKQGRTALHNVKDQKIAAALLKAGANPNAVDHAGKSPLHLAKNAAIVHTLVAAGANPRQIDRQGLTPLACAKNIDVEHALHQADISANQGAGQLKPRR